MTVTTKFDIGDYAYAKWEKGWYLVKIEDIIIVQRRFGVTGAKLEDDLVICYGCEYCSVTDHPEYKHPLCLEESELYKQKEEFDES